MSEAYEEGYDAALHRSWATNPYSRGTSAAWEWEAGYEAGLQEYYYREPDDETLEGVA